MKKVMTLTQMLLLQLGEFFSPRHGTRSVYTLKCSAKLITGRFFLVLNSLGAEGNKWCYQNSSVERFISKHESLLCATQEQAEKTINFKIRAIFIQPDRIKEKKEYVFVIVISRTYRTIIGRSKNLRHIPTQFFFPQAFVDACTTYRNKEKSWISFWFRTLTTDITAKFFSPETTIFSLSLVFACFFWSFCIVKYHVKTFLIYNVPKNDIGQEEGDMMVLLPQKTDSCSFYGFLANYINSHICVLSSFSPHRWI